METSAEAARPMLSLHRMKKQLTMQVYDLGFESQWGWPRFVRKYGADRFLHLKIVREGKRLLAQVSSEHNL